MGIFGRLFKRECKHNWHMEEPTYEVGNFFKEWEGPIMDICTKCGATRPHPECQHVWESVPDNGKGSIINGKKCVRTAICSKCGAEKYELPQGHSGTKKNLKKILEVS